MTHSRLDLDPGTGRERSRLAGLRVAGSLYPRSHDLSRRESVLLIRPDHLGDLLLLTPALHALRNALPEARLTLLVGPWSADILRGNNDVDEVLTLSFPGFERRPKRSILAPYLLLFSEARRLRRHRFDISVALRFDHWWGAWLAAAAAIPRRIGYALPEVEPFLTEVVGYVPDRHEALQNAALLSGLAGGIEHELGSTYYSVSEADRGWASRWLAQKGLESGGTGGRPLVAIHPGTGAAVKQWPVRSWANVGADLIQRTNAVLLVTGGTGETALAAALADQLGPATGNLAGQTSLGQLAALYEKCSLVLGSDSGPLHLAVAVGTPTVHLFGPVPAAKFGPWGDPDRHIAITSDWACVPCDRLDWPTVGLPSHACMSGITPQMVLRAAHALLEEFSA